MATIYRTLRYIGEPEWLKNTLEIGYAYPGIKRMIGHSSIEDISIHLIDELKLDIDAHLERNNGTHDYSMEWMRISLAPKDRTIEVYCPPAHGLNELVALCMWHEDAGFCVDELRTPTHFRLFKAPKNA